MPKQNGRPRRGRAPYSLGGAKGTPSSSMNISTTPRMPPATRQRSSRARFTAQQARQPDQGSMNISTMPRTPPDSRQRSSRGRFTVQQARQPDRGSNRSTLTRGDVSALLQEVVQSVLRQSSCRLVDSTANVPDQTVDPTVTTSPGFTSNGNSQTADRWAAGYQDTEFELPLTREDIPILVQQVLQALPGPSTSVSGHFSIIDDPPPPLQS